MKRFYVKQVSQFVTIVHRPTHQTIVMGELTDEMKLEIIRLAKLTTEEFYEEMVEKGMRLTVKADWMRDIKADDEEWYKKAWSYTSKKVLKQYGLDEDLIPEEEYPFELVREMKSGKKKRGWGATVLETENKKEEKRVEEKPKKKKLPKKLKKKLPKKVKSEKYKSKEDVRKAFSGGEIDATLYKELMLEFRGR